MVRVSSLKRQQQERKNKKQGSVSKHAELYKIKYYIYNKR